MNFFILKIHSFMGALNDKTLKKINIFFNYGEKQKTII